jgi:hypothetical protein
MNEGVFLNQPWESLLWSVILLAEFLLLALLAGFFQKLLGWESAFNDNKKRWMDQLRQGRRRMRTLRRKVSNLDDKLVPALFLPNHGLVRKLMWGRLAYRFVAGRRTAKS